MTPFKIMSHGRLAEWVAEEHDYFAAEGLDYVFEKRTPAAWSGKVASKDAPAEVKQGAFEAYEAGRNVDVSCACHWMVNMAASAGHGKLYGDAYSVTPSGVYVAPESEIRTAEDLADVEISVGYHSGSHYSTLEALESILPADRIRLDFGGLLFDRLDLLLDRRVVAGNAFGAVSYVLEQQGFRKVVDSTFMIAALLAPDADPVDVERYYRALQRAQHDIDLAPWKYTHYFLEELPAKYHGLIDTRTFGAGERIIFSPYDQDAFDSTHDWMMDNGRFPAEQAGTGSYAESVVATR